jgi:hypothetical protein
MSGGSFIVPLPELKVITEHVTDYAF